jgi:hypothetical protein
MPVTTTSARIQLVAFDDFLLLKSTEVLRDVPNDSKSKCKLSTPQKVNRTVEERSTAQDCHVMGGQGKTTVFLSTVKGDKSTVSSESRNSPSNVYKARHMPRTVKGSSAS